MNDVGKITTYTTLLDILESNRGVDRAVTYVEGENSERRVPYSDVYKRALGILLVIQHAGPNDKGYASRNTATIVAQNPIVGLLSVMAGF